MAEEAEPKTELTADEPAVKGGNTGGRRRRTNRGGGEKTCYNCGETGHLSRECTNPRLEGEARQSIEKNRLQFRRCFNCGRKGHISADCSKPPGNKSCYNCGQEGHILRECPNAKETAN